MNAIGSDKEFGVLGAGETAVEMLCVINPEQLDRRGGALAIVPGLDMSGRGRGSTSQLRAEAVKATLTTGSLSCRGTDPCCSPLRGAPSPGLR